MKKEASKMRHGTYSYLYIDVVLLFIMGIAVGLIFWSRGTVHNLLELLIWPFIVCLVPSLFILIILALFARNQLRSFLSWAYIEEQGVRNVCIGAADIIIPWDGCCEIGVFSVLERTGSGIAIYFSRCLLSENHLKNLTRVPISEDFIWVQYSKALHKELMCHIDNSQIKNYDLVERYYKKWLAGDKIQ